MSRSSSRAVSRPRRVVDYSFEQSLATACAVCGIGDAEVVGQDGYSLLKYLAPISERCPVATFVGVCRPCLVKHDTNDRWYHPAFLGDGCLCPWSPPTLIRPVDGEHLYVARFGHADDSRVARVVGRVWQRLPADVRASMRKFLCPRSETDALAVSRTLSKGALRVEAFRSFPGSRGAFGQCLHWGHTVRLSAPAVNAMPDAVLMTLVAHEIAHVFQKAAYGERLDSRLPDVEDDARALMADWGFNDAAIDRWSDARDEERWKAKLRGLVQKAADDESDETGEDRTVRRRAGRE